MKREATSLAEKHIFGLKTVLRAKCTQCCELAIL